MRVLVACEFSGVVRQAFARRGHDAWSVDLEPTELPGQHIVGDALDVLDGGWDLLIAHPPCTYLAASGARWWKQRRDDQWRAVALANEFLCAPVPRIALENPVGFLSRIFGPPDQIIQPWWFGHDESKATCLWLKGLPPLLASIIETTRHQRIWRASAGPGRARFRSRTYLGVAEAMAQQWG